MHSFAHSFATLSVFTYVLQLLTSISVSWWHPCWKEHVQTCYKQQWYWCLTYSVFLWVSTFSWSFLRSLVALKGPTLSQIIQIRQWTNLYNQDQKRKLKVQYAINKFYIIKDWTTMQHNFFQYSTSSPLCNSKIVDVLAKWPQRKLHWW